MGQECIESWGTICLSVRAFFLSFLGNNVGVLPITVLSRRLSSTRSKYFLSNLSFTIRSWNISSSVYYVTIFIDI